MSGLGIFAANPIDMELVWLTIGLIGAVFVGTVAMWGVKRWWRQDAAAAQPEEQAESFRALYEEGLLSQEEFNKISLHLEKKAQTSPAPPAAPDKPV